MKIVARCQYIADDGDTRRSSAVNDHAKQAGGEPHPLASNLAKTKRRDGRENGAESQAEQKNWQQHLTLSRIDTPVRHVPDRPGRQDEAAANDAAHVDSPA